MDERESIGRQVLSGLSLVTVSAVLALILLALRGLFEIVARNIGTSPYHQLHMLQEKWSHSAAAVVPRLAEPSWIPLEQQCFLISFVALLPLAGIIVGFASGVCRLRSGAALGAGLIAALLLYAGPLNFGATIADVWWPEHVSRAWVVTATATAIAAVLNGAFCWSGHALGTKLMTGIRRVFQLTANG